MVLGFYFPPFPRGWPCPTRGVVLGVSIIPQVNVPRARSQYLARYPGPSTDMSGETINHLLWKH